MNQEKLKRIKELVNQINALPKGYISTKKIGGNIYYYHQWTENGKKYSKYLSQEELEKLNPLIEERQKLEQELKDIKRGYSDEDLISYTLMHLNVKVIDLFIDRESGLIRSLGSLYSPEHLPLGTIDEKGFFNNRILIEWWNDRSIPLSRSGIKEALEKLDINSPQSLLIKCYGLSLSDQYWIKPKDEIISWEEINFFDNAFSDDVGEILLGGERKKDELNLSSPDNTSVGNLKKKWKISGNKRVMIKGGSAPFRQEPFNEVIAYKVAKELDINCIEYKAFYVDGYPYSECEDFISKDSDLITAYQIGKLFKKSNNDSTYTHLLKCTSKLGIENVEDFFNKMITLDFIIANEDRHLNNFGFIRNAETLEFIGPAPIFDSGASLGFNKINDDIKPFKDIESKPFKTNILEQLKLVTSFEWIKIEKLDFIKNHIEEWLLEYESKYLDKDRIKAISESVRVRIDYLMEKANTKKED